MSILLLSLSLSAGINLEEDKAKTAHNDSFSFLPRSLSFSSPMFDLSFLLLRFLSGRCFAFGRFLRAFGLGAWSEDDQFHTFALAFELQKSKRSDSPLEQGTVHEREGLLDYICDNGQALSSDRRTHRAGIPNSTASRKTCTYTSRSAIVGKRSNHRRKISSYGVKTETSPSTHVSDDGGYVSCSLPSSSFLLIISPVDLHLSVLLIKYPRRKKLSTMQQIKHRSFSFFRLSPLQPALTLLVHRLIAAQN